MSLSGPGHRIPVAIFVDRFIAGGTQRQMIELLTRLDRSRFRVLPVCFHRVGVWFDRVAALGEPVATFPISGFPRVATARRLLEFARWCRSNQIAILQTCEVYSNIFALPGGALASVPVRIGSRRGFVESQGLMRLQRGAYSAAHRIVANSRAAANKLLEEGVPDAKILVIPNGIDMDLFPSREYTRNPRRIAVVACLREEKRIDLVIKAAPAVLAHYPDAEFVIAGDGSCRDALVTLARERRVLDRFTFLGHRDDVPAVLAGADLFTLPSRSEAFPNSIIEAMASGLPVVATAVGGIPELVDDGRTGTLVPSGDGDALARALIDLLGQPERIEAFGRAGRRRVQQTYSFERMVEQFERLYVAELAARAGRTPLKEAV